MIKSCVLVDLLVKDVSLRVIRSYSVVVDLRALLLLLLLLRLGHCFEGISPSHQVSTQLALILPVNLCYSRNDGSEAGLVVSAYAAKELLVSAMTGGGSHDEKVNAIGSAEVQAPGVSSLDNVDLVFLEVAVDGCGKGWDHYGEVMLGCLLPHIFQKRGHHVFPNVDQARI